MKEISHKMMSLFMAIMVLFSTLSFTINMHYCGDILVDTAIFKEAQGCGMAMQQSTLETCSIAKKDCCSDEQLMIEGQDDLKLSFDKQLSFEQQLVIAFNYSITVLFESGNENIIPHQYYKPPLVVRDIQKLDEVYLI